MAPAELFEGELAEKDLRRLNELLRADVTELRRVFTSVDGEDAGAGDFSRGEICSKKGASSS